MSYFSKLWAKVDPYLPDEQIAGAFRGWGGSPQEPDVTGYQPSPADKPARTAREPGFLDRFAAFAHDTNNHLQGNKSDELGALHAAAASKTALADLLEQAEANGASPLELASIKADPEGWLKGYQAKVGETYGFHDIAGGNTGVYGDPARGGHTFTAPKLTDHEGVYGTQGPGGYIGTGRASPSTGEVIGAAKADEEERYHKAEEALRAAGIQVDRDQLREAIRHNTSSEGIQRAQEARLREQGGGGGGWSPPTDPMAAVEAELRRRGLLK